jgi:pyruvate formate lyase activating enzyme
MFIETLVYEKLSEGAVRCRICQRRCRIKEGEWGHCRTRLNRQGKLFSTIYGEVASWRKAPIEIKPVFHYLPGSYALSLGSVGCNFLCPGCQNWDISFAKVESLGTSTRYFSPEETIALAKNYDCQGISWTYNEPTLWFEFTFEGARLAKIAGLYTNYVTNGYITPEALDKIAPYLDVFRVDLKAFSRKSYQKISNIKNWQGILKIIRRAKKKWHMHVELVTNVIPKINDDPAQLHSLVQWIKKELGSDTPWHITRFFPQWHLCHLSPTPIQTLEEAREMGLSEGLQFVYIGNVSGHPANHTYCPACGKMIIRRSDSGEVDSLMINGSCPFCGESIPGRFK